MNIDFDLYSRQLSIYGLETMKHICELKILIIGLRGLGIEIAKNIILSGPKSLTLLDKGLCDINDMGSNFFITYNDLGKNRDIVCIKKLSELNEYVELSIFEGDNILNKLDIFNVVIITEIMDKNYLFELDKICREKKIGFIYCLTLGLTGFIFTDFGINHIIKSKLNQEKKIYFIKKIVKPTNNKIIIIIDGNDFSLVGEGKYVKFREIKGLEELNNKIKKVRYVSPESFEIDDELNLETEKYVNGGIVEEIELEEKIEYKSLENSFEKPYEEEILERFDKGKINNEEQLHLSILSIHEYFIKNKCLPEINNLNQANIIIDISKNIFNNLKNKNYEWIEIIEKIDEEFIKKVSKWSRCQISPICSFIGGIASQEILKYFGKFTPINQWIWFDFFEILQNQNNNVINRDINISRYNEQIAIFGNEFQEKIKKLKIFIIGAGALGCEYLKNLSMMGICCDNSNNNNNSNVTITDNDCIEISNLNRQFLFSKANIGQSKSKCACDKVKNFNEDIKCNAQQMILNEETENYFDEDFWMNQDFILNAVDNNEARNYIDKKCCFFSKPYIDTGTLGTVGSCFIFYPYKTQCFRDIPIKIKHQIPMCTLKQFPSKFEHCVEFAKSKFAEIFEEYINDLNLIMKDFDKFDLIYLSKSNEDEEQKKEKIKLLIDLIEFYEKHDIMIMSRIIIKLYNKYFVEDIKKIITSYPENMKNKDGSLFWSGSKRFPKVIVFDSSHEFCLMFFKNCLKIFLKIFKCEAKENNLFEYYHKIDGEQISNLNEKIIQQENLNEQIKVLKELREKANKNYVSLIPVKYDKDNEIEGHLQFIHAFSVLRASNYNIERLEMYNTRIISGNIIPALSTTTSVIVGFSCIQLYSMILNSDVEHFRCANINLANNFYDSWVPPKPNMKVDCDLVTNSLKQRVLEKPFSAWESINIEGSFTAREFIDYFEKKYNVIIYFLSCNDIRILEPIFDKKKDQEEMKNKYNKLIEVLFEQSNKKLNKKKKILELRITCKRGKFLILCPTIKYYIKKK